MIVEKKLQIYLILFATFLLILSMIFKDFSAGKFIFYISGNSIVGLQSFFEELSIDKKIFLNFYNIFIFILNLNIFFIMGLISFLISFLFFFLKD